MVRSRAVLISSENGFAMNGSISARLQVYLPMSYLYGIRARCRETDLIRDLRHELYPIPYDTISWDATRNCCAKVDFPLDTLKYSMNVEGL